MMGKELLLFVGTLNGAGQGPGLIVYGFDEDRLSVQPLASQTQVQNPSFLSVSPDGTRVYANSEGDEGLVTALAFDRAAGVFAPVNTQPTMGSTAAHNLIAGDGRLYVVNYNLGHEGQSLAVFDIRADGGLTPPVASVAHQGHGHGHGPDPDRQDRAHSHSVTELAPGVVMLADLGLDQLVTYRVADGGLTRWAVTQVAPGAGPRHAAVHPGGGFVFVTNELNSTVTAHAYDPATGALTQIDSQPAAPSGAGRNYPSDIQISPDGRFLYGGNRGHDSIAVFAVDQGSGRLTSLGFVPCGGAWPRHLALTPSGGHLLCANQNGGRVSIFARDADTGALRDTGRAIEVGTPMCLKFAVGV
jgi:6-phosphogluconolactonase